MMSPNKCTCTYGKITENDQIMNTLTCSWENETYENSIKNNTYYVIN